MLLQKLCNVQTLSESFKLDACTEIIEECNKRLAVLEQYAPKMMDEAEIKEVVASVLAEMGLDAPTAKDKGKIMKNLMPKVKGKADGKLVNEIVSTFMK